MKTGRNAPCPCGSGRKYKKCCLRSDEAKAQERVEQRELWQMASEMAGQGWPAPEEPGGGQDLSAYTLARIFEMSEQFAAMQRDEPERAAQYMTIARVRGMETGEIITRLQELGIDGGEEAFVASAEGRTQAWPISAQWLGELPDEQRRRITSTEHQADFVGLAACELWRRHMPDRPSMEMLDDWMQEGYERSEQHDHEAALELWGRTWEVIRGRLTSSMTTYDSSRTVFNGFQFLSNWLQDYEIELLNAANVAHDRQAAEAGLRLCEEILAQFVDEAPEFLSCFDADRAEFLFALDRPDEGERLLRQRIEERPDDPGGYTRLADLLPAPEAGAGTDGDPRVALLERAARCPDAASWDVELRLSELRQPHEDARPGGGATSRG